MSRTVSRHGPRTTVLATMGRAVRRAAAQDESPRCGVCTAPSTAPLCPRCRAAIGSRRPVGAPPLPCPLCPALMAHHVGPCTITRAQRRG